MSGPVITFWRNLTATKNGSEWRPSDWSEMFKRLSDPKPFRGDQEHPGWSAARFEPCERALENVREVYALCLDYDNKGKDGMLVSGPVTLDRAAELWAGSFGLIHTSRSHTDAWPRFRVVLPLSRPVSKFEYSALWRRVKGHAGAVDDAPKDPSRFWFLSGVKEGGSFATRVLTGAPLDVDAWLSKPEPAPPAPPQPRQADHRRHEPVDAERRAIAYVRKLDGSVSGQGGDAQLWRAACHVGCGFDLSVEQTFSILWHEFNPRCSPPWEESRVRYKANQTRHSTLPRGYLLNAERDNGAFTARTNYERNVPAEPMGEPDADGVVAPAEPSPREPGDDSEDIRAEQARPKSAAERYPVHTERALIMAAWEDARKEGSARGFTTGVKQLDEQLGGLRPGHIALLAAQTSWGKSTVSSMIVTENRKAGVRVLLVSNEDMPLMYGRRLACSMTKINALRMRDRTLKPHELSMLGELATSATDEYMYLNAIGMPVETVGKAIAELCAECGFQLVICDYLQRFRSAQIQDRRNEVTGAMGILSDSIKKAGAAGLVLSQLKRTEGRPPTMNDVKESGDVENMAEHVMIGWREVVGGGQDNEQIFRRINVPKNKDGPASEEWMTLKFSEVRAAFLPGDTIEGDSPKRAAEQAIDQFDDFPVDNSETKYP